MPALFSRNKSRYRLSPLSASRKLGPTNEANACRMVLSGFPRTTPFSCTQEVAEYLRQDQLTCLLCGKLYTVLTQHITRIHNLSSYQYKQMFRIPLHSGLRGQQYKETMSQKATQRGFGIKHMHNLTRTGPGKPCRSEYNTMRAREATKLMNKP